MRALRAVKVTSYLVTAGSPSGFDVELLVLLSGDCSKSQIAVLFWVMGVSWWVMDI